MMKNKKNQISPVGSQKVGSAKENSRMHTKVIEIPSVG